MSIISEKPRSSLREQPVVKPRGRWRIGLALAAAVATGAAGIQQVQQGVNQSTTVIPVVNSTPTVSAVTALGRLEPKGEVITLSAPSSAQGARVERLLVKEGQRVKAGDVIAILDNNQRLKAALDQAKGQVQVAQAKLATIKAGAKQGELEAQRAQIARLEAQRREEIVAQQAKVARQKADLGGSVNTQRAKVNRLRAELRNAETDYQRYQALYKSGAVSAQEVDARRLTADTAREEVNEAEASRQQMLATLEQQVNEAEATQNQSVETLQQQINEAKATLNKLAEIRPTDVQEAQAELDSAIAAVKQAEAELELTYIRAPVTSEAIKIHTWPGETIGDKGIVEMGQTNQMLVVAEVMEQDIGKIRLGQRASITSENAAFPGKLQGTVVELGRQIGKQDVLDDDPAADVDARVVEVKIGLPLEDGQKVSGLTYAKVVVAIKI